MSRPRLAVTVGDPAGIGPELAVRLAAEPEFRERAELILYGPPEVIRAAARQFTPGWTPALEAVGNLAPGEFVAGEASAVCGRAAYDAVVRATADALAGRVAALVTAPVNKYAVNLAGIPFTGHTELIAGMCGVQDYAMMQSSGRLRVAFVTTHIPLREVVTTITEARIRRVAGLLAAAIREEGIAVPRLAVAAINPHAGENGRMGLEDEQMTRPALEQLRAEGLTVEGPFPPDTLFLPETLERFDGVVSMYHDQGHIPFKMLAFHSGVNSTLGLPIIRTSPDHGTAFDLVGRGAADPGSMAAALRLAIRRAERRQS